MRPSKPLADMRADAHRILTRLQGYQQTDDGNYRGRHYCATITDAPGVSRAEKARLLGLAPPSEDGDVFDNVVIRYAAIG